MELGTIAPDELLDLDALKERTIQLARRKAELLRDNAILAYRPNPLQEIFQSCFRLYGTGNLLCTTGNRGGKTRGLCNDGVAAARGRRVWLSETHPDFLTKFRPPVIIRMASTPDELRETMQMYVEAALLKGEVKKRTTSQAHYIDSWTLTNLSRIRMNSYKQDPEEFEGAGTHVWLFNEPPKRKQWIAAIRGLADTNGYWMIAMTAISQPWIKHEIVDPIIADQERIIVQVPVAHANRPIEIYASKAENVAYIRSDSLVNVGFGVTKEGLDEFHKRLKPAELEARRDGGWLHMSGLVVSDFRREHHVVSFQPDGTLGNQSISFKADWFPNQQWNRQWGVYLAYDPHKRKNHHVLLLGVDPEGTVHLFKEWWGLPKGLDDLTARLRSITEGLFVVEWLIDAMSKEPSDQDATASTYTDLCMAGFPFQVGTKNRAVGIDNIQNLFKLREEVTLDTAKKPQLKRFPRAVVWSCCPRTIDELENWPWKDPEEVDPEEMLAQAQEIYDDAMSNLYRILHNQPQHVNRRVFEKPLNVGLDY